MRSPIAEALFWDTGRCRRDNSRRTGADDDDVATGAAGKSAVDNLRQRITISCRGLGGGGIDFKTATRARTSSPFSPSVSPPRRVRAQRLGVVTLAISHAIVAEESRARRRRLCRLKITSTITTTTTIDC